MLSMKLAFIMFKYFPYGGVQRNALSIARACVNAGHQVDFYTLSWQGETPDDMGVNIIDIKSTTNHKKYQRFHQAIEPQLKSGAYDLVVGFNKLSGLDFYYAGDPCYIARKHGFLSRLTARFKIFSEMEAGVFSQNSKTHILVVSEQQKPVYQECYGTDESRFHTLPPGISRDRIRSDNHVRIRQDFRKEVGIVEDGYCIALIGSGFKTKGMDRAILAFKSLPEGIRNRSKFFAIGQDNHKPFLKMIAEHGLQEQIMMLPGRDDIPRFLLGSDLLIHPAYRENTGNILLEAMLAGLPVLCTDVCGYAHYVETYNAGVVLPSPFEQTSLNDALLNMLTSDEKQKWQSGGLRITDDDTIYSRPEFVLSVFERQACQ